MSCYLDRYSWSGCSDLCPSIFALWFITTFSRFTSGSVHEDPGEFADAAARAEARDGEPVQEEAGRVNGLIAVPRRMFITSSIQICVN